MKPSFIYVIAIALAAPAAAQVEITPFAAYRWGGNIESDQNALNTGLDVEHNGAYGLVLQFPLVADFGGPVVAGLGFELSATRQPTNLVTDPGLFGPESRLSDLDVTYYHGGVVLEFPMRDVTPFLALSAGVTTLEPDAPELNNETRFSGSFGGGAKVWISRNVGVRFEARGFATALDEDDRNFDCGPYRCDDYYDSMNQAEARLGLIVTF